MGELTDEQIDERIARYHDVACGYQRQLARLEALADALAAVVEDLLGEITALHEIEMGPDGPDNCAAMCLKRAFVQGALGAYHEARRE